MVTADMLITAVLAVLGLAATGGGFLYRRDTKQQEDIDENADDVSELDRGFAELTTRLFGYPGDDSDKGAVPTRADELQAAENDIDSLSAEVHSVKDQSERNGRAIEALEERVDAHAAETRSTLNRIEEFLSEQDGVDEPSDLFSDGGQPNDD